MLRTKLPRVRAALLLLSILITPIARSAVLPLSDEQYFAFKLYVPGCLTTGSYDVPSQIWRQSGSFSRCAPNPTVPGPGGTPVTIESFETRLLARVDNHGNAIGGVFTLFGAVPALGIEQPSLLLSGSLIDAYYGPTVRSRGGGIQPNALIELDFALPVFGNAGDILLWQAFTLIRGWSYPPEQFPDQMPWQSSIYESDYHNYTNSQYLIYDRRVFFAPEPAMLVLLGLWLLGIIVGRSYARSPRARQSARNRR
jgi:hypothetical protein